MLGFGLAGPPDSKPSRSTLAESGWEMLFTDIVWSLHYKQQPQVSTFKLKED